MGAKKIVGGDANDMPTRSVDQTDEMGTTMPPTPATREVSVTADFSWAYNVVKLNRAKAWVNTAAPGLLGKALEAAVKARYEQIGGLLVEDKPNPRRGRASTVVNLGEDDGSED